MASKYGHILCVSTSLFLPGLSRDSCTDWNEFCPAWGTFGECDRNIRFMREQCAFSCGACSTSERLLPPSVGKVPHASE